MRLYIDCDYEVWQLYSNREAVDSCDRNAAGQITNAGWWPGDAHNIDMVGLTNVNIEHLHKREAI